MGGTVSLNSSPAFNSRFGLNMGMSLGSFGKMNLSEKLSYGTSRIYLSAMGSYGKCDNDFLYTDRATIGFPTDMLRNARVEQYGLLVDGYFKASTNQIVSLHYWGQNNNSEVPPNMISAEGYTLQYDR